MTTVKGIRIERPGSERVISSDPRNPTDTPNQTKLFMTNIIVCETIGQIKIFIFQGVMSV